MIFALTDLWTRLFFDRHTSGSYDGSKKSVFKGLIFMKNPMEVLRSKEQEISRIKREIDALRVAARILSEDGSSGPPSEDKQDLRQLIEMP